jgi:hypothetical protein
MRPEAPRNSHATNGEVASYLDGTLASDRREQVERHLADCRQCRDDLLEAARVIRARKGRRIRYLGPPLLAAAAVIALLVVNPWGGSQTPVLRNSEPGLSVTAVSPAEGGLVPDSDITFLWRSRVGESRYRFTLTNAEGDEIWLGDLTDTVFVLPAEIDLIRGETYFWYVDVLLLDGRSATTGVQSFGLQP